MIIDIPALGKNGVVDVFSVQTLMFPEGSYNVNVTGMATANLIETVTVAFSILRLFPNLHIAYENKKLSLYDFHVHFTNGSFYKEGTSAGLGVIASIISCVNNVNNDRKYLMTGEIDLYGNILAVGGIEEKMVLLDKDNYDGFVIPYENWKSHKNNLTNRRLLPVKNISNLFDKTII